MDKDVKKIHDIVAMMNAMLLSDTPLDIGTMEEIGKIWKAMDRVEIKVNSYNSRKERAESVGRIRKLFAGLN